MPFSLNPGQPHTVDDALILITRKFGNEPSLPQPASYKCESCGFRTHDTDLLRSHPCERIEIVEALLNQEDYARFEFN